MHIALGLIIAFVIVVWAARRRHTTRNCRWRAEASGNKGSLRKYRCAFCGAEAFTAQKGPPNMCNADIKAPKL